MERANRLAGRRLADVADAMELPIPPDLRGHKGWIGHVLERALGATAGSDAGPDFPALGIELKTIPVDDAARPKESTWVCTAPLDGTMSTTWERSHARAKLAVVLWVPIVGDGPPGERRIGTPVPWTPTPEQEATLRRDWEDISSLIRGGELERLDARLGAALQLRPKAASSRDATPFLDASGDWVETGPRGYYLRASFTRQILAAAFAPR